MMIFHPSMERVRERFAEQFEPVGDQFLYRRRSKYAPIRVSAAEKEQFIAAFNRSLRIVYWGTIGAGLVVGGALGAIEANIGVSKNTSQIVVWGFMLAVVAAFIAIYLRAFNAPSVALRDRYPEGGERSKEEIQRLSLARMPYSRLIVPLLFIDALLTWSVIKGDMLLEENRIWLAITAVSVAVVLAVLYRKWRFDTEKQ